MPCVKLENNNVLGHKIEKGNASQNRGEYTHTHTQIRIKRAE